VEFRTSRIWLLLLGYHSGPSLRQLLSLALSDALVPTFWPSTDGKTRQTLLITHCRISSTAKHRNAMHSPSPACKSVPHPGADARKHSSYPGRSDPAAQPAHPAALFDRLSDSSRVHGTGPPWPPLSCWVQSPQGDPLAAAPDDAHTTRLNPRDTTCARLVTCRLINHDRQADGAWARRPPPWFCRPAAGCRRRLSHCLGLASKSHHPCHPAMTAVAAVLASTVHVGKLTPHTTSITHSEAGGSPGIDLQSLHAVVDRAALTACDSMQGESLSGPNGAGLCAQTRQLFWRAMAGRQALCLRRNRRCYQAAPARPPHSSLWILEAGAAAPRTGCVHRLLAATIGRETQPCSVYGPAHLPPPAWEGCGRTLSLLQIRPFLAARCSPGSP